VADRRALVRLGAEFQVVVRKLHGEAAMARALAEQLGLDAVSR
jgi:hypothetical protein